MLDAFKAMTGGKGRDVQKQTEELQLLIANAREVSMKRFDCA